MNAFAESFGWAAAVLYAAASLFLAAQGLHSLWLLLRYRRHRHGRQETPPIRGGEEPAVLVQLPVYHERDVVARLVSAVGGLDWPKDRLRIQLLDDGTDDSVEIGAAAIEELRAKGLSAEHVRRADRTGYKAGALEHGLALDEGPSGPAPFVAIFDADFVPPRDFLRRALAPLVAEPDLAFVQARWDHLNPDESLLTRAQAIGIDGHFAVEQAARAWSKLALNFNGTCGVWRRGAIERSGGWQHDTLTEDLDLSYRAQLLGFRACYRMDISVPGELPPTIEAWRSQQFRWAKGSLQCARKLLPRIWRSSWPLERKVAALMHLSHYLVHPAILASLLLAPFAIQRFSRAPIALAICGILLMLAGLLPPILLYAQSQAALGRGWKRLAALPALMSFGTGIALSNTRAAVEGLLGTVSGFVRTPKHGGGPGSYRARPGSGIGELAVFASGLLGMWAIGTGPARWFSPILLLYVVGFGLQGAMLLLHRAKEALEPGPDRALWPLLPLGAIALAGSFAIGSAHATFREAPIHFAGFGLLVGASCFSALEIVRSARPRARWLVWIVLVGIGVQWLARGMPLADDLARYAVEGRQVLAGENPYSVPPASTAVGAALASKVGHAEMTSIYPPLMLALHAGVQRLWPGLEGFRAMDSIALSALGAILLALLAAEKKSPLMLVAVLWNPVVAFFGIGEGHHDLAMAAALAASLLALRHGCAKTSIALASCAALLKPFAAVSIPFLLAATSWRLLWIPIGSAALAYLPFAGAGFGLVRSLLAFGGDMHYHGPLEPGLRIVFGALLPAGVSGTAVRCALGSMLLLGLGWLAVRSRNEPLPGRVARAAALLLLCLPTLHPWYFTVLAALLPLYPSRALMAWTAAAPIYWLHGLSMPEGAPWSEWPWATAAAHLPFVAWMLAEAFGPFRAPRGIEPWFGDRTPGAPVEVSRA
ncbi:MAG: hypothetical protein Fur0037_08430 [Planctomycetota bacterium]